VPTPNKGPDLAAAIKLQLTDSTDIAAFGIEGIYTEWPKKDKQIIVPEYKNCIMINSGVGGRGDVGSSLQEERVDLFCYGTNKLNAYLLWRFMDWWLYPQDRSRSCNFLKAHCRVYKVQRESGPLRLVDPDIIGWHYTMAPYIFTFSGVPTP
jgi:hypothetical protein